jgi:hypothetical protein
LKLIADNVDLINVFVNQSFWFCHLVPEIQEWIVNEILPLFKMRRIFVAPASSAFKGSIIYDNNRLLLDVQIQI